MAPADGTGYLKGETFRRQKVAIVGSGLAGLTTAYLLNRDNFDVEIFEMVSLIFHIYRFKSVIPSKNMADMQFK